MLPFRCASLLLVPILLLALGACSRGDARALPDEVTDGLRTASKVTVYKLLNGDTEYDLEDSPSRELTAAEVLEVLGALEAADAEKPGIGEIIATFRVAFVIIAEVPEGTLKVTTQTYPNGKIGYSFSGSDALHGSVWCSDSWEPTFDALFPASK